MFQRRVITVVLAPGAINRQCPYYKPRDANQTVNCPNCKRLVGVECQGHLTFLRIRSDERIEKLMAHDAYRREHGGVRQVRQR